jgi:subtilisin
VSLGRVPTLSLSVALCVVLLAALLPVATMAAPGGNAREYIVTLDVAGSGTTIRPSSKAKKTRIRQRAARADEATDRVTRKHGVKAGFRYGSAFTGFSATMTPQEAAQVAADPQVSAVHLARTFKLAGEQITTDIKRTKAWDSGTTPGPDVNAHVAVLDTGIGPADANGTPLLAAPAGAEAELNIRDGVNCFDDPLTETINEAEEYPGRWGDTHGHGTHVAGIIGARDNAVGRIGVAPGAKLWPVRVFQGARGSEAAIMCGLAWAIETHTNETPDIGVINLSIEGPRRDKKEDCDAVRADPNSDGIQVLICDATDSGITVVAAAGNDNMNANNSSPGGFDQVISVGALSDFDGVGWGAGGKGNCSGYRSEDDDTYASYSNWGPDVDIVAPGTCIASTYSEDPSGDALVTMTGTSMAAPQVTGAVARYLAGHADTTPDRMRRIVRAAGRMDWDAQTDPVWSGANDTDQPNRVLDVKALSGGDLVRAWAYHQSFRIGGSAKVRITRVDVQRGGGYAGTVNLAVSDLPGSVGSGSFGDSTLDGLAGLGTKLTFSLKTGGSDGVYDVGIKASGAGVSEHRRPLELTIDRTPPKVIHRKPRVRGSRASMSRQGATQTILQWQVSDVLSDVRSAQLQRKTGVGAWRSAGSGGLTSAKATLKPGQANKFRVKATDSLGNVGTSVAIGARLSVRDSKSPKWQKPAGGAWKTKKVSKAFGRSILLASGATDSLTTPFYGKAVAVVGSIGRGRGRFRVRVDSGAWSVVNLRSNRSGHRKVVLSRRLDKGNHTLQIQGLRGQTALDAILIIR